MIQNKFKIIHTEEEVRELITYCKTTKYASIDFETSDFRFYEDKEYPTVLGCSFQIGFTYVIPLGHFESPIRETYIDLMCLFFKEVVEDQNIVKIAWNIAFEHKWIKRYGYTMRGRCFDAMLAKYLLKEDKPSDLKSQVTTYLPEWSKYEMELPEKTDWSKIPLEKLIPYNSIDCDATLRLFLFFEDKLIKLKFYGLFRNLIMPLRLRVLDDIEFRGINVDRPYLEKTTINQEKVIAKNELKLRNHPRLVKFGKTREKTHIKKLIDKVQKEIEELEDSDKPTKANLIKAREEKIQRYIQGKLQSKKEVLEEFNFNSTQQMAEFLFTKGGMNFPILEKTDSGNPSTAEVVLEQLKKYDESDFLPRLLDHRGMQTLYGTFLKGSLDKLSTKNKLHTSFKVHGTVTGRLSSVGPNLQNIPRVTTSTLIKPMFIPPKGYLLLEVDYSQAELRIVAELANDQVMIDIFKRGYNIHFATACKINGKLDKYNELKAVYDDDKHPKHLYWVKQHKKAKTVNFGILYGEGPKKLSEQLECSVDEAKKIIKDWLDSYPGIKRWITKTQDHAMRYGYVTTIFGRKRRLPDAMYTKEEASESGAFGYWAKALRDAINAPVQGGAVDFALFSMIVIRDEQIKGNISPDIKMVYQVHDSIGFYIRPKDIHKTVPKLVEICNNPQTMKYFGFELKQVKMKVSPEVGKNWGNLKDYNAWENYSKWID